MPDPDLDPVKSGIATPLKRDVIFRDLTDCVSSAFSAIFLGGVMDSLQEMFYGKPKTEESEEKKNGEEQSL